MECDSRVPFVYLPKPLTACFLSHHHAIALDLEWILHKIGAIQSSLEQDPRKQREKKTRTLMSVNCDDSDSD